MKKVNKTANVVANIYEGEFSINFDCVGVEVCRYALCHMMPPDGSEECTYRHDGSCLCSHAKASALETLVSKIKKGLKQLEEEVI